MKTTIERGDLQIIICGYYDDSPVYVFGPLKTVEKIAKLLMDWVDAQDEGKGK